MTLSTCGYTSYPVCFVEAQGDILTTTGALTSKDQHSDPLFFLDS